MVGDRQRLIFSFDSEGSQGVVRDLERIERGGRDAGEATASGSKEARTAIEAQTEALRIMREQTERLRRDQEKQAKEYEKQLAKLQERLADVGREGKRAKTDAEKLADEIERINKANSADGLKLQSEEYKKAAKAQAKMRAELRQLSVVERAATTDAERLAEEIQQMGEETAFTRLRLSSREYRRELRRLAREQRRVERLQMSWGEQLQSGLEGFENLNGAIGAVELLTTAMVGLYNAVERGGVLRDLAVTMERIEAAGGASASSIAKASGGLLTQAQSSHISVRGTLAGQSSVDAQLAAELGKVLGTQLVQTGDAEDIREATNASSRSIQDELATAEVGDALRSLGVDQERYELALRREAQQRGVTVDVLSLATKREILRARAMEAAGLRSRLLSDDLSSSFANFETSAADMVDKLAKLASGGVDSEDEGVSATRRRERIEEEARKIRAREGIQRTQRGGGRAALGADGAGLSGDAFGDVDKRATETVDRQIMQEEALLRSAQTRTKLATELNGLSSSQLDTLGKTLEARTKEERAIGFGHASLQTLTAEDIKRLEEEEKISTTLTDQIRFGLVHADTLTLVGTLRDKAFLKAQQELQSERDKLSVQMESNTQLSVGERLALKRRAAVVEEKLAAAETVGTLDALNKLFEGTLRNKRLQLSTDAEIAAEIEKQGAFQTKAEKKAAGLAAKVAAVKSEAAQLAKNQAEYAQNVTKAALVAALENNEKIASRLEKSLKRSGGNINDAVNAAAKLAAVVSTIPGANKAGGLLADGLLSAAVDAPEEEKKGGGGSSEDARDALLFQAGLVGLDDLEVARAEARQELEKNLELAGKNAQLVEAAHRLFWDSIAQAEDDALGDLEDQEQSMFQRYASGLAARLQGVAQTVTDEIASSRAKVASLSDLAIQEQLQGESAVERQFAEEMQALEKRQLEERERHRFHGEELLRQERLFEMQRQELHMAQEEKRQEEDEREVERLLQKGQRQAQHFAAARQRTSEFDSYVQENLSTSGQAQVHLMDTALVAGEQSTALVGQIDAINSAQLDGAKKTGAIVSASATAAAAVTSATIKNQRARAGVLALMEVAHAAGAFAMGNPVKGAAHILAAAKYGVVAAISPKSAKNKSVKHKDAPIRRSLTPRPDGSGRTQRDSGPIVINQVFVKVDPLSGKKIAEEVNSTERRGQHVKISSGVIGQSFRDEPLRLR